MQGFGYDLYEPQVGSSFDSKIMTPHRSSEKGHPGLLIVKQVIRPGVLRKNVLIYPPIVVLVVKKTLPQSLQEPEQVESFQATA